MKLQVLESAPLTEQVHHIALGRSGEKLPDFRPGQYTTFFFESGGKEWRRSYSLGTPHQEGEARDRWDYYAALVPGGPGSTYLQGLRPGDTVVVGQPRGIFTLRGVESPRLVLVATSTGLVPFRSMKPALEERLAKKMPVSLLMGCRHAGELLFVDEWHTWLEKYESFEFVPCLSQPRTPDEHHRWGGILGRVQVGLRRLPLIGKDTIFMLCGNPDMVEEVEDMLIEQGVKPGQILVEIFESADE